MSAFSGSTVGLDDPAVATPKLREPVVAALHELSERLTAANNYIAASLRLSELGNTDGSGHADPLEKALTQLQSAAKTLNSLRKLLQEEAP